MAAGAQAKPTAYMQYQPSANANLSGAANATLILQFPTDRQSFPNGFFTKSTAARIDAVYNCTVRVSYGIGMDANNNNEGWTMQARINGTVVAQSIAGENARSAIAEGNHLANTFVCDMDAGQYIELVLTKTETNTLTMIAAQSVILVELIRLR